MGGCPCLTQIEGLLCLIIGYQNWVIGITTGNGEYFLFKRGDLGNLVIWMISR